MGSQSIGSAALILSTNNAGLDAGLNKAKSSIGTFGASFGGIMVAGQGMFGGIIAGARTAIDEIKGSFDRLKTNFGGAKKLGVDPADFAQLAAAAQIAGVPTENLGKSLNKLLKNISDLKAGDEGAKKAFAGIGLAAEDLQGTALDSVGKIAASLQTLKDPADKAAMLLHLGGKSATDLLPLLNNYEGLSEKAKKFYDAENSGSEATAKAARAWRTVTVAINSIWDRLTQALAPAIESVGETLEYWASEAANIFKGIGNFMNGVKGYILDAVSAMLKGLGWLADAASKLPLVGDSLKGIGDELRTYADAVQVLKEPVASPKVKGSMNDGATRLQIELLSAAKELTKKMADEADQIGLTGNALEAFKLKQKGLNDEEYIWLKNLAEQADLMQKAFGLVEQSPLSKFQDEIQGLNMLVQKGAITWDQYYSAVGKASGAIIQASNLEQKNASASVAGSQEAANSILQNQINSKVNPQDQLKAALDIQTEIAKQSLETEKQQVEALKALGDKFNFGTF